MKIKYIFIEFEDDEEGLQVQKLAVKLIMKRFRQLEHNALENT